MTPQERKVRAWLLKHPRPAVARLSSSDGVPQEIKLVQRSLAKVAETIVAINPDLIEALDKDGSLIRAMRPETPDVQRSDAAEIPDVLKESPEAAMLTHCANLIHRAYEHSTEIAFSKLVELVERMDARSEAIETRLERTEANYRRSMEERLEDAFEHAQALAEQAEQEGSGLEGKEAIMAAFMQGAMGGFGKRAPNGTANGKAKQ